MLAQEGFILGENFEIFVSDNQSGPETWNALKEFEEKIKLHQNDGNYGFAGGHNRGIARCLAAEAEYILVANADLKLEKNMLANLVKALAADSSAGLASPKLYRADGNLVPVAPETFDAAGMYFTTDIRHFDRGSQEIDRGQFEIPQYVFGATGAAMLLKRSFVLDAQYQSNSGLELFDDSFFVYREDADLSWRAQALGWNCLYEPSSIAYHVRIVLPEKRAQLPQEYNRFGVRNRFLMQINNLTPFTAIICLKGFVIRNLIVVAACIVKERTSLQGIKEVFTLFPNAWNKRQQNIKRKRRSELNILRWFGKQGLEGLPVLKNGTSDIRKVSAIVVNYNSGLRAKACTEAAVKSFKGLPEQITWEIIIVDNSSENSQLEMAENDSVKVIRNDTNLGFSGAINKAVKATTADALLILNPDVLLEDNCATLLVSALANYPELGAVGASLYNTDGTVQLGFSARRFPNLLSTTMELLGLAKLIPNNFVSQNYLIKDDQLFENYLKGTTSNGPSLDSSKPVIVDQPAGACLMLRRTAYDQLGGFDEEYFPAWFEDVDYCKRLKKHGWLSAVFTQAKAIHEGGYSLSTMSRAKFFSIWYANLLRYWKRHGKVWESYVLRALVLTAIALRASYFKILSLTKNKANPSKDRETANELFELLRKI